MRQWIFTDLYLNIYINTKKYANNNYTYIKCNYNCKRENEVGTMSTSN